MQYPYSQVKNPKWANEEQTAINCEVNFEHLPEEFVPFTATASGDYPHTHEIFARCVAGEFGQIQEYVFKASQGEDFIPVADVTP
jgi:hypothetical protein